jgi:hypothetical protein
MALPKITHPVFKINIPSTKKTYGFRPYTVKEEKLLLFLKDNDNISEVLDTIKQIINNCCVEEIDTSKLSLFDIEYIFIKLRSQSVGSIIELVYRKGEQKTEFVVDLSQVEVEFHPEHQTKFIIYDNIGVAMSYPTFESMLRLEQAQTDNIDDAIFDMFVDCIDNVFDDNKVYTEFTKEEMSEFILSLPRECIDKIKKFLDTMPVLEHKQTIKYKDGSTEEVVLRGLKDFFIF